MVLVFSDYDRCSGIDGIGVVNIIVGTENRVVGIRAQGDAKDK